MANYQQLKNAIQTAINNNGQGAITGQVLQDVLKEIVDVVGEGYTFVGLATPNTVPSSTDSKVFYLASQTGTYTYFDNIVVEEGLTILKYDTVWSDVQVLSFDFIDEKLDTYIAQTQADIDAIVSDLESASTEDVDAVKDILVANNYGYSVIQDIGHSTSSNKATIVSPNTDFSAMYQANEGSKIYGAVVTMGGNDITSSAVAMMTRERCSVHISSVTGNVEIIIIATKPIVFVDQEVKALCVQYWGGQYIEGEITEYEASRVNNLGADKNGNAIADGAGPFYNNQNIEYFDEFRYFTGIVGRGIHWANTGNTLYTYRGKFALSTLKKITFPHIETESLAGVFYYCSRLEEADLTDIYWNGSSVGAKRATASFQGCTALKKVIFPDEISIRTIDSMGRCFGYNSTNGCSNLEYVDFKSIRFTDVSAGVLRYCPKLAHLPSGMQNLSHSENFSYNPLTHDSAVNLLMTLATATGLTITFAAATYATLTEDEIAIGTDKGWTVTSA